MIDPRADIHVPPAVSSGRARVIVVDDDTASRLLLIQVLEGMGYAAEGASDGREALERIQNQPPEIVLLDLDLPGISGSEVCTRLRHHKREELRNIPVIMLTALDGEAQEVACLQAGANDFVAKPIGRAVLAARVATQLRLRALNETLRVQNEELERWRAAQIADLEAAQQVQRAILPVIEERPGWRLEVAFAPIIQVGGDIYGAETLPEGKLVWLADATGHGVAAALCTTLVALLFERAAIADLERVLVQVNADMLRIFHKRSIMSAACVLLSPNGELRFAGAGHPPLLVRRADGSVASFQSQGTVLGVLSGCAFSTDVLQLEIGDCALLLTDGLYSTRRPDGERCSIEDVLEVFAHNSDTTGLIETMRRENAFDDDVTAISMTRSA